MPILYVQAMPEYTTAKMKTSINPSTSASWMLSMPNLKKLIGTPFYEVLSQRAINNFPVVSCFFK
jgi:hypothetical protein